MTFTRRSLLAALAACAMVVTPGAADAAAPGQLHPAFSPFAERVSDVEGNETATGVAIAPGGRIVASVVNDGELDRRVVALNRDGSRDLTFSEDGTWSMPQANETFIRSVAVQPDGKVLFIGDDQSTDNVIIGRLMVDGELDPTFGGGDGLFVITQPEEGSQPRGEQLILLPDGRILFAGSVKNGAKGRDVLIGRLTPAGALDATFTGSPYRLFGSAGNNVDDRLAGIVRMPNGELIVASAQGLGTSGIWRIGPNGEWAIIKDVDLGPGPDQPLDLIAVDASHVMVLASGVSWTTGLARVEVTNTPKVDATFASSGIATPFPNSFLGQHLQRQVDGKFVVAGVSNAPTLHRAVVRTSAAGLLDSSFGSSGFAHLQGVSAYSFVLRAHELAIDADGSIVFAAHAGELGARVATVDRLVGRVARVQAQLSAPAGTPTAGADMDLTLRVTNNGPDDAGLTAISFTLGSGLQLRGVSNAVCLHEGAGGGRCHFDSLAPGATRTIVVHARAAQPGTYGASMAVAGTTWDDSSADDAASVTFAVAAAPSPSAVKPAAKAPRPAQQRLRVVKLRVQKITKRRGRVQRCGTSMRKACRTTRVRTGRRAAAMFLRATSRPLPTTERRQVEVVIQRRVGKRWVKKGGGDLKLDRRGRIEFQLPVAMRSTKSVWRVRTFVQRSSTMRAARSSWFYVRVR